MKIKFGLSLLILVLVLSACQPSAPAQPIPTLTPVPGATALPPATAAPVVPAATPADTPTAPAPTAVAPSPTVAATTNTPAPSDTPSPSPTASPTKALVPRPNPTATSAGPLSAQIYVANCHSAPTADKPGNVDIQISIEAKGGNGVYQYAYEGTASKTKFIDIQWEKGTRLIGKATVTSGDGQSIDVVVNISTNDLTCS